MRSRPTTDLCCLFANSVKADIRQKHLPELLDLYHQHLVSMMLDMVHIHCLKKIIFRSLT